MIESVPLIQNANDAQQINASIIAMKKASKELDEKILKLNNLNKELDKKIAVLDNGLAQEITDRENAINALDVAGVGGSGKYISAISETDGKISATVSDLTSVIESGNTQPVTSDGVARAIQGVTSLPTDAVLHYSFDDVPDYPDGTADLLIQSFTSDTSWTVPSDITKSIDNNCLKLTSDGSRNVILATRSEFYASILKGKIVKLRVLASSAIYCAVQEQRAPSYPRYNLIELSHSGNEYIFCGLMPSDIQTLSYLVFYFSSSSSNNYVLIKSIYIGDGSYSTPIIDNANGQNNATNNGGIATKGVSGKGLKFLGNNYIKGNLPWKPFDKAVFTVSCWIKDWDSDILAVINDWENYAVTPLFFTLYNSEESDSLSALAIYVKVAGNYAMRFRILKPNFDYSILTNPFHIVGVFNGENTKVYINGKELTLEYWDTVPMSGSVINNQYFQVGRTRVENGYNYSKNEVDDLLIFDRALSDTEVQALYQNKANTPKYYSWADWKLSQV